MLIDAYEAVPTSEMQFEFECDCDGGIIKKLVRYSKLPQIIDGKEIYNLGFGPYDEDGNIIDNVKTSTSDLIKTLATVAKTSIDFTDKYINVILYAVGFDNARTRLYQIYISKYFDEIHENFIIYGQINEKEVEPFKKERDNYHYIAFFAIRKIH